MIEFAWVGRILVSVGMLVILGERFRAIGLAGLLIHLICACWVGYASQRFGPAWPLETLYPVGALAGSTLSGLTGAVIWAAIWWPADAFTLPVRKARRLGVYLLPTLVVAGLWTVLLGVANNYANNVSDWPVLQSDSVTPLLHWFVFGLAVFCVKILATRGAGLAWRLPVALAMTLAPTLYFARFGRSLPSDGWDLWLMVAVLALAAPASAQAVRSVEARDKVLGGRRAAILVSACLSVLGGLAVVGWVETNAEGRRRDEAYRDDVPHDWLETVGGRLVRRVPKVTPLPPLAEADGRRVIMIGLDGADWRYVTPMIEAGRLPNLQKIVAQGAVGLLETDVAWSPISWTTLATGRLSSEYGLTTDLRDTDRTAIFLYAFDRIPREIKYRRIWEIAEDRGLNARVFRYYFNRDREPNLGFDPAIQFAADHGKPLPEFCRHLKTLNPDGARMAVCSALSRPFDLFMTLELRTDEVGHLGMMRWFRLMYPQWFSPAPDVPPPGEDDMVMDQWRRVDEALGGYWENRTPGTYLVLASDHGFTLPEPSNLIVELSSFVWEAVDPSLQNQIGAMDQDPVAVAPGITVETRVKRGRIPYLRYAGESFTRYVNTEVESLVIRADESVEPGWAEAYRGRVIDKLIENAYLVSMSETSTTLTLTPDTSVVRELPYRLLTEAEQSAMTRVFYVASHFADDEGILLVAGPGVVPGTVIKDAHLYDVAPTMLYMLGLPSARDLKGRVLTEVFDSAFLENRPVDWIDTYEKTPIQRDDGSIVLPESPRPSVAHKAMIERLRALGYLQ